MQSEAVSAAEHVWRASHTGNPRPDRSVACAQAGRLGWLAAHPGHALDSETGLSAAADLAAVYVLTHNNMLQVALRSCVKATDIIRHSGTTVRIVTVNQLGSWGRAFQEGRHTSQVQFIWGICAPARDALCGCSELFGRAHGMPHQLLPLPNSACSQHDQLCHLLLHAMSRSADVLVV